MRVQNVLVQQHVHVLNKYLLMLQHVLVVRFVLLHVRSVLGSAGLDTPDSPTNLVMIVQQLVMRRIPLSNLSTIQAE